jgi:hypothetical protein
MKQLLFLLLFPCLAMAQYQGNAGQKITLGEQTTADGLVFRGRLADTANLLTNKLDTSVYIVLDTGTRAMWYYRASTTPKWTRLVDSLNNLQGTLSLAKGGTGADMSSLPNNYLIRKNSSGIFDTAAIYYTANGNVGIGVIPDIKLHISAPIASDFLQYTENSINKTSRFGVRVTSGYEKLLFNSYNIPMYLSSGAAGGTGGIVAIQTSTTLGSEVERMRVNASGNVGINTPSPTEKLHVDGNGLFTGNVTAGGITSTGTNTMLSASNSTQGLVVRGGSSVGNASVSSGQILVGATSTYRLSLAYDDNTGYAYIDNLYDNANSNIYFRVKTSGTTPINALTLFGTGAATFNSSVTATTGIFTNYAGGGTTAADIDNTGQIVRTSSIELKKDITNIKYGLNEILQIKPINFNWKNEDKFGNENENGFIAEDVINIIPNVVGSDANGIFMSYNKLIPILTKAIQEQQALIKALEQRILILENK